MTTACIRRCPEQPDAWGAYTQTGMMATATSLDILVSILTERHGPLIMTLHTAHLPGGPDSPGPPRVQNKRRSGGRPSTAPAACPSWK